MSFLSAAPSGRPAGVPRRFPYFRTTVLSRPGAPSVGDFIAAVATKGGTTAAGKDVLDASDVRSVYAATLAAAARRAAELAAQ